MGVGATECGKLEILTSSITLMNNQTDWSGLAGLGPLSVLLAGWEVRPCGHFLGQLRLSWVAAQQHSRRIGKSPGATQEAFMRDRYVCLQQTPQDRAGNYNTTLFASCMGARGYKEDPNGDLSPPPQAVVGH